MTTQHEWRERTADGRLRRVRTVRERDGWRLSEKFEGEEHWARLDPPGPDDLAQFHRVLDAKYRRRRAPYEHLLEAEKLLRARRRTP